MESQTRKNCADPLSVVVATKKHRDAAPDDVLSRLLLLQHSAGPRPRFPLLFVLFILTEKSGVFLLRNGHIALWSLFLCY
jgi:hypothetical protein